MIAVSVIILFAFCAGRAAAHFLSCRFSAPFSALHPPSSPLAPPFLSPCTTLPLPLHPHSSPLAPPSSPFATPFLSPCAPFPLPLHPPSSPLAPPLPSHPPPDYEHDTPVESLRQLPPSSPLQVVTRTLERVLPSDSQLVEHVARLRALARLRRESPDWDSQDLSVLAGAVAGQAAGAANKTDCGVQW